MSNAAQSAAADAQSNVKKFLENKVEVHMLCHMVIAFELKGGNISFAKQSDADFMNASLCTLHDESHGYSYCMNELIVVQAVKKVLQEEKVQPELTT